MKKFTKICLATALATFLLGCLLGCVGTMLGGLRQLEHTSIRQLTGIPFRYVRSGSGMSFGFWDDDWDDNWDDDLDVHRDGDSSEWRTVDDAYEGAQSEEPVGNISGGMPTGLTAASLRELDLAVGACRLYIVEAAPDEQVSIDIRGECEDHYRYQIKDGNTLLLVHKDMKYNFAESLWEQSHPRGNTMITLYLPKGTRPDKINIDFGAGKLESCCLSAGEIEINVGAGECAFDGLEAAESVGLSLGAGNITTKTLIAKKADMDIAAGELRVDDAKVAGETQVAVSMGNAIVSGAFAGGIDMECSMGNLDLTLEGAEEDYNYEVECGAGSVRIDDKKYKGVVEREIYNDSTATVDITCSMGNVNVNFTK